MGVRMEIRPRAMSAISGRTGTIVFSWPVDSSREVLDTGRVISVRQDVVRSPVDGAGFTRDVVVHPGAVGVVALDDDERVLLVRQYRHPVGHRLLDGRYEITGGLPEGTRIVTQLQSGLRVGRSATADEPYGGPL